MSSQNFTALDFETANPHPCSICQVGLVRLEGGRIIKEIDLLVKPPNNFYLPNFIDIHKITPHDTEKSPTFNQIWMKLEPFIAGKTVVAHNGHSFDFKILKATLEYYGITPPDYTKQCTLKIYKANLKNLCEKYHIPLNHHDALSDAKACAELFLKYLNEKEKSALL